MCAQGLGLGRELVDRGVLDSFFETLPIGVAILDEEGRAVRVNEEAKRLLGFTKIPPDGPRYEPAPAVMLRTDGLPLSPDAYPCERARTQRTEIRGEEVGYRDPEGKLTWICITAMPIPSVGVLVFYQDVTSRREHLQVAEAHRRLVEQADTQSLEELLVSILDEAELLTNSMVGFLHFVSDDQQNLSLQAWSRRTTQQFCRAEGKGSHCGLHEAGVWVDAARERRPVIHNDYASLPHRKGLPPDHAPIQRVLVVPVLRGGKLKAILGVGNKLQPYGTADINKVQHLTEMAWDLAEKRQTEETLHLKSAALECSLTATTIGDRDGRLRYVNHAFVEMWRLPDQFAALGRKTHEFWENPAQVERLIAQTLERGSARAGMVGRRHDGSTFDAEYVGSVVRDEKGAPIGLLATVQDTTERHRTELMLRQSEEKIRQAQRMESLGSLAGGVAHDMNNVLGAILGIASALADGDDGDGAHARDYDTIVQACLRGRTMVRGLLDFTRQELVNWHRLDLNLLVEEQIRLIERTLPPGITLELELSPDLHLIKGDPSALGRALLNLMANSVDALGTSGRIRVCTANHATDQVELSVTDDGPGMPQDVREKAIEPFFTTKPLGKGTGLGLAIVYGTVKAHRGQLELTSNPGEGTRVALRFPAEQRLSSNPPREQPPDSGAHMTDLLVLLVDDDALVTAAVSNLLRHLGHRVVTAPNGQEALAIAETTEDLAAVILDLNMPIRDGRATLPRLRALYPKLPVIIATGRADEEACELSRTFAHVSILPKPFSLKELRSELEAALDTRRSLLPPP